MSKHDNIQSHVNSDNACVINSWIREMLLTIEGCDNDSGFNIDYCAIKESFGVSGDSCSSSLSKLDIFRQLVLIDSLYSTNVNRMRQFGIAEICEDIWKRCDNHKGNHTLGTLTTQLDPTKPLPTDIAELFTNKYGYIKGVQSDSAPSLISKYFFFATTQCPLVGNWGFPIYDTIACDLLRSVQRFLGIPPTPTQKFSLVNGSLDIDIYIDGLRRIVVELEKDDYGLWNHTSMTKFQILDYFLWHIGKAGKKSYNLLLTKNEVKTCYNKEVLTTIPHRISVWEQHYKCLKSYRIPSQTHNVKKKP